MKHLGQRRPRTYDAFYNETNAAPTAYFSEVSAATPEVTPKREESTDASTAPNSHTRHADTAANQGAYSAPAPNAFWQSTLRTSTRNAERSRNGRPTT